jgi:lipoprotein-releasing system permease protein
VTDTNAEAREAVVKQVTGTAPPRIAFDIAVGAVLLVTGLGGMFWVAVEHYVFAWVIAQVGMIWLMRGVYHLIPSIRTTYGTSVAPVLGWKTFVAWRYLLVHHPKVTRPTKWMILIGFVLRLASYFTFGALFSDDRTLRIAVTVFDSVTTMFTVAVVFNGVLRHSLPAMITFLIGAAVALLSYTTIYLMAKDWLPFVHLDLGQKRDVGTVLGFVMLGGILLAGLAVFFGMLRAFFTFFTTVPIGGVWIGTCALVAVLSVMSGFENDLRQKILGSNAHIQVSREDGDLNNWKDIKKRIDAIPGVVASTPFAVSEVVIAANNNGMNVIIKGIDPDTVGTVTDLVSDLEDRDAMKRLAPMVDDPHDLKVPQKPHPTDGVDPAPDDMPSSGDPIDFSGSAAPDPNEPPPPPPPIPPDYGGDASQVVEPMPPEDTHGVVDPPPGDLIAPDEPPVDYSKPDAEVPIRVTDLPPDTTISRRTQSLPGVLVGRELVKQTHLYTGEEVRVVSPLSDPSNPDATGTPIPFNRDYRVAGIFYTGMYEYDLKYIYVSLESLQEFLDRGDAVDGIEVRVDDPDDTDAYVKTIGDALGAGYRVVDWKELNRSLFSALKLEKIAMFLVLGIVILVASFSIIGNLIMVVVEKGREIALLKTLGASDLGVMQTFAIQGLLIGVIGTSLGVAFGLVLCWGMQHFGLPLNPDVYYIDRLPINVDSTSVIATSIAGIAVSLAATIYPSVLAARVRPAAGMRH